MTLEQLKVTQHENIHVDDKGNHILINFTPTIPHCSMATLIGNYDMVIFCANYVFKLILIMKLILFYW